VPGGAQTRTGFVELLDPNLGSLPQHLAHVAKGRVGRAAGGHFGSAVVESPRYDVQAGVQFGEVVCAIGQLFGVQGLLESLVGASHALELLRDIAVALLAVTGRGSGGILQLTDRRPDLRRTIALGVRRYRSRVRELREHGKRRKELEGEQEAGAANEKGFS